MCVEVLLYANVMASVAQGSEPHTPRGEPQNLLGFEEQVGVAITGHTLVEFSHNLLLQ